MVIEGGLLSSVLLGAPERLRLSCAGERKIFLKSGCNTLFLCTLVNASEFARIIFFLFQF